MWKKNSFTKIYHITESETKRNTGKKQTINLETKDTGEIIVGWGTSKIRPFVLEMYFDA